MRGVAAGRSVCAQRKERLAAGGAQRSPDPSPSAPNCANQLDRPDQLVELCRTAVPQEIAYLRHRERLHVTDVARQLIDLRQYKVISNVLRYYRTTLNNVAGNTIFVNSAQRGSVGSVLRDATLRVKPPTIQG